VYMSPYIETIKHFREVWWDFDNDREYYPAVTGTPFTVLPTLHRRRIEDIYGKQVHKGCGGELDVVDGYDCGKYGVRLCCKSCGFEFCAEY
jgi:hypothetical protein